MEANELRIGNYVLLKCKNEKDEIGKLLTIDEINGCYYNKATNKKFINQKYDGIKNSWCKFEIINPILLTEKWLLKLGFDKGNDFLGDCFFIEFSAIDDFVLHIEKDAYYWNYNQIKITTIHQLQNLFFALTGEELNKK